MCGKIHSFNNLRKKGNCFIMLCILAKYVIIPPKINVSRRKSPAALAAIDYVANASAREAAPAKTTWNPTVALTTDG